MTCRFVDLGRYLPQEEAPMKKNPTLSDNDAASQTGARRPSIMNTSVNGAFSAAAIL